MNGAVSFLESPIQITTFANSLAEEWKDEKFKRFGGDLDEDEGDDAFGDDDPMNDFIE